jgi:ABC-type polysaccharide/polyol phosphate export permease
MSASTTEGTPPANKLVANAHALKLAAPNPLQGFWRGLPTLCHNLYIHRQLVWAMCMRDIRLKYRGSAFGYFWSLLEPLLMAFTYVAFFWLVKGSQDKAFALLVVNGVITWGHFASVAQRCQGSLTGNSGMIESIYVPREIYGLSAVLSQLIMTILSLFVAVPFMIYLGIPPTWEMLIYVPAGLLLATAFGIGIGMGSAPWNVLNRDVEYFFNFITRAGMFLSPVMWDSDTIGKSMRHIVVWNPLLVPMEMVKKGVTGRALNIDAKHIIFSIVVCLGMMVLGLGTFRRMEGTVVKKL